MKLNTLVSVFILTTGVLIAQTLSITTNAVIVAGTQTNRIYSLEAAGALGAAWTSQSTFRGSNGPITVPVPNGDAFYRTATMPILVTNFWSTGNFTPYTPMPGHWQAFPQVNYDSIQTGQLLTINSNQWVVFVNSGNLLEIRTVNSYSNSPTFSIGDEVFLN